jgi:hypothetical protein
MIIHVRQFLFFTTIILIPVVTLLGQTTWTEDSFEDFRDGSFLDAGSNLYVSAKGRIQMINRWDFNNDGYLDILLCSGHGHTEKENTFIYLNNGKEIEGRTRIELPGGGSKDGIVADFNQDGYNDIAIANAADSHFSRVNAWIWYGSADGFKVENRIELPAYRGKSIVAGDFNNDSWLDLAIACQWQAGTITKPEGPKMSFIYWNSAGGFSPENRLPLIFEDNIAINISTADLDNDQISDLAVLTANNLYLLYSSQDAFVNPKSWKELAVSGFAVAIGNINQDEFSDLAICSSGLVRVIPGSAAGYNLENASQINVSKPVDACFSDVNLDGYDDLVIANNATATGITWTDSYVFLSDKGEFSPEKCIKLPTLGATGVSVQDLNGDTYPEVVLSNQRITRQLNIASYIYWNKDGNFYFGHHTQLPTLGANGNAIGDVNNDGFPDIVFFNEEGYFRDGPEMSYLYWGDGTRNFSEKRRTAFHTHHIFGQGHADLDDDGNVDLILSQERFVATIPHEQNGLIIYWGGSNDFAPPSILSMEIAYGGTRIADINKDGYLDLVAGGAAIDIDDPTKHGIPIYWGSEQGFIHENRTIIHYESASMRAPLLMDLNRDKWLDIAGQVEDGKIKIWWGSASGFHDDNHTEIDLGRKDHLMYIKGADFNKDGWIDLLLPKRRPHEEYNTSFIYYGSESGFSNDNRTEVEANIPYECSISDFDRDGWLDIFMPSYGTDLNGNRPSVLHWGGPNGFDERPKTEFLTYGASGSEALDYDGDGWLDLLVANHRQAGSTTEPYPHRHTTISMLYWGGPEGYSDNNRWEVLATGPSGLNVRDPGNSYDRKLYEDYLSSIFQIPDNENAKQITWQAETPHGSEIKFQVRLAEDEKSLLQAIWYGADGPDSWYTINGSNINNLSGKMIQYRARLISPNGGPTPILTKVSIKFD